MFVLRFLENDAPILRRLCQSCSVFCLLVGVNACASQARDEASVRVKQSSDRCASCEDATNNVRDLLAQPGWFSQTLMKENKHLPSPTHRPCLSELHVSSPPHAARMQGVLQYFRRFCDGESIPSWSNNPFLERWVSDVSRRRAYIGNGHHRYVGYRLLAWMTRELREKNKCLGRVGDCFLDEPKFAESTRATHEYGVGCENRTRGEGWQGVELQW